MSKASRTFWLALGLFFVGLGTIGIFVPLLPTVVFYLIAAGCYAKSNPEQAERLYNHPTHGHHLRAWRDRGAISSKGKVAALSTMTLSIFVVWFTAGGWWPLIPTLVLITVGTWIWTRPE